MTRAARRSAIVLLGWGLWLGALTAIQAIFVMQPFVRWFVTGLLGGASFACLLCGLAVLARDLLRRGPELPIIALVESSAATVIFVAGFALALLGANFGLWAAYIGGTVALVGIAGLAREERGRRRSLSRARALEARAQTRSQKPAGTQMARRAGGTG